MRNTNLTRQYFFVVLFSLLIKTSISQIQTTGSGGNSVSATGITGIPDLGVLTGNLSGQKTFMALSVQGGWKLPAFPDVEGSPYLHKEYNLGFVKVRSGFSATGVQVKFNVYGNEIIFIQNGNELALDSVESVSYSAVGKNGTIETIDLRTGFPPIADHTTTTIYQVLDSGSSVQLLKYSYKKMEEVRRLGETGRKEFVDYNEHYINIPKEGMKKIKLDVRSIKEALPQYAEQIDKIVLELKLKLKKESDLIRLFEELNKQTKAF